MCLPSTEAIPNPVQDQRPAADIPSWAQHPEQKRDVAAARLLAVTRPSRGPPFGDCVPAVPAVPDHAWISASHRIALSWPTHPDVTDSVLLLRCSLLTTVWKRFPSLHLTISHIPSCLQPFLRHFLFLNRHFIDISCFSLRHPFAVLSRGSRAVHLLGFLHPPLRLYRPSASLTVYAFACACPYCYPRLYFTHHADSKPIHAPTWRSRCQ